MRAARMFQKSMIQSVQQKKKRRGKTLNVSVCALAELPNCRCALTSPCVGGPRQWLLERRLQVQQVVGCLRVANGETKDMEEKSVTHYELSAQQHSLKWLGKTLGNTIGTRVTLLWHV